MRKTTTQFIGEVFLCIAVLMLIVFIAATQSGCAIKKRSEEFNPVIEHSRIECENDCYE